MPVCEGCGRSYNQKFKFCPNCGRARPEATTLKINLLVTSDDKWETCEIYLSYAHVKSSKLLLKVFNANERQYLFEAAAIGSQGRYSAALSEPLIENLWWRTKGTRVGDYHHDEKNYDELILHKNNAKHKLDGLIKDLISDGWEPISRGQEWYSERFRRRIKRESKHKAG